MHILQLFLRALSSILHILSGAFISISQIIKKTHQISKVIIYFFADICYNYINFIQLNATEHKNSAGNPNIGQKGDTNDATISGNEESHYNDAAQTLDITFQELRTHLSTADSCKTELFCLQFPDGLLPGVLILCSWTKCVLVPRLWTSDIHCGRDS